MLCLLLAATAGCDRVTKHLAVTSLAGGPGQSRLGDTVRLNYHEDTHLGRNLQSTRPFTVTNIRTSTGWQFT